MTHEIMVPSSAAGKRLDIFLAEALKGISRSHAQRLIESGNVLVEGKAMAAGHHLKGGEHISIELPVAESTALLPATIPLDIVYEDAYIIVLNKPPGLVVHPGAGHTNDTLVNALLAHTEHLSHIGDANRPGIVHRLDKDTSGLLIIAKEDNAHLALNNLMQERKIHRHYLALVWGEPREAHFSISANIGRKPSDRKQMAVISDPARASREAQTEIQVREKFGEISLVEASLSTGRTHQVRVHLSYAGHPVVGDPVYGLRLARAEANRLDNFTRQLIEALPGQALHAYKLAFPHPISGEPLEFQTEPPEAFGRLLEHLRLRIGKVS